MGTDSAFDGSCKATARPADCPANASAAQPEPAAAKNVNTAAGADIRADTSLSSSSSLATSRSPLIADAPPPVVAAASASAAANPNANRKLLTVSKLSLLPCSKSTFARMSPYLVLAVMPAGMVAKTKRRRNLAPKLDAGGVFASSLPRK